MNERVLTARQVADHLGVSAATVLDRWERGDLPGYKLWNGPVRFRLSEIEANLESCHRAASLSEGSANRPSQRRGRRVVSQPPTVPFSEARE